jgi:PII-like signaling protein
MDIQAPAQRVTIYLGESNRHGHRALHTAIVELLRREGCAGVTVLRGVEGYGRSSRVHSAHILRLSGDLPMVVEFVDSSHKVEALLELLDPLLQGGLVTVEDLRVHHYTAAPARPASGGGE